ncbi:MAG TPA: diacylglycerol kinase family protein [Polyangiaceae bacterium]|nr:diacylglycerol kinase family protein [Polyangiaceae bacterium]
MSILPASQRVAVVVNGNARNVTGEVISTLGQIMMGGDLFVSRSLPEAGEIAKTLVDRGYGTVLTGGGDGTFTTMVTKVVREAERQGKPLPRFGFLKMGTGNALAYVVGPAGAKRRELAADIQRLRVETGSKKISLVEVEDTLTPFCGFGLDALVLEDYQHVKSVLDATPFKRAVPGLLGYAIASTTRTIPRYLWQQRPNCRVINRGAPAMRLDATGREIGKPIESGEIIYEGPARLVGISTIPYYGFGLRAFPFAQQRPDRMQLRIVNVGLLRLSANLREVWSGTYQNPKEISDYLIQDVLIEMNPPTAFQIGGDAAGNRSRVAVKISSRPIRLVDFYAATTAED